MHIVPFVGDRAATKYQDTVDERDLTVAESGIERSESGRVEAPRSWV